MCLGALIFSLISATPHEKANEGRDLWPTTPLPQPVVEQPRPEPQPEPRPLSPEEEVTIRERLKPIYARHNVFFEQSREVAIKKIERQIARYEERIPEFVEEVFSFKNQTRFLWYMISPNHTLQERLDEIWAETLFSQTEFQSILLSFYEEHMEKAKATWNIIAYEVANELLLIINEGTLPGLTLPDARAKLAQLNAVVKGPLFNDVMEDTRKLAFTGLAGGLVVGISSEYVIEPLAEMLVLRLASKSVSRFAGILSFGISLAIGILADIAIEEMAKSSLEKDMASYFSALRQESLYGADGLDMAMKKIEDEVVGEAAQARIMEFIRKNMVIAPEPQGGKL